MILGHWGTFPFNSKEKIYHRQCIPVFLDKVVYQKWEDNISLSLIATSNIKCLTYENMNYAYNITNVPLR